MVPVPLSHSHPHGVFLVGGVWGSCFEIFQLVQNVLGSSCIFPVPFLEPGLSPRNLGSFYWRMALETKIWAFSFLSIAPKDHQLSKNAKTVGMNFVLIAHVKIKYKQQKIKRQIVNTPL